VVESAPSASGFQESDRVTALLDSAASPAGGYAEIGDAAPGAVPPSRRMSFDDAAAFTLIYQRPGSACTDARTC